MNGLVDTSPFVNSTAALWLFQYMKKKNLNKAMEIKKTTVGRLIVTKKTDNTNT